MDDHNIKQRKENVNFETSPENVNIENDSQNSQKLPRSRLPNSKSDYDLFQRKPKLSSPKSKLQLFDQRRRASDPEFKTKPNSLQKRLSSNELEFQEKRKSSPDVRETSKIEIKYDNAGYKTINNYVIIKELGRGVHGKVKLCIHSETSETFAMKIVKKIVKKRFGSKENNPVERTKAEIAILKKCDHPNVVKLYEVLDNPESEKIYLILEYLEGGSIIWKSDKDEPLIPVSVIPPLFRDVLLGIEYLHLQGILHRDIKPANLLLTRDYTVKISDFGVSHYYGGGSEGESDISLIQTVGTPAFFAPEMCVGGIALGKERPPITKAIDIWALGVTLFCIVYGRLPFNATNEFELFQKIQEEPVIFDDRKDIPATLKDLLLKLLEKDPLQRITIPEIKQHPWVTSDLPNPEEWIQMSDLLNQERIHVTLEEVKNAVTLFTKIKQTIHQLSSSFGNFMKRRTKSDVSEYSSSTTAASPKRPSIGSLEVHSFGTGEENNCSTSSSPIHVPELSPGSQRSPRRGEDQLAMK